MLPASRVQRPLAVAPCRLRPARAAHDTGVPPRCAAPRVRAGPLPARAPAQRCDHPSCATAAPGLPLCGRRGVTPARAAAVDAGPPPPPVPPPAPLLRPAGYWPEGSVPSGATLQHEGDLVIHGAPHPDPDPDPQPQCQPQTQHTLPALHPAPPPAQAPSPRGRPSSPLAMSSAWAPCRALSTPARTWGQAPTRLRALSPLNCAARACASRTRTR
jgi:hypothetical protein